MDLNYENWPCAIKFATGLAVCGLVFMAPFWIYESVLHLNQLGASLGEWLYGPY